MELPTEHSPERLCFRTGPRKPADQDSLAQPFTLPTLIQIPGSGIQGMWCLVLYLRTLGGRRLP